MDLLQQLLQGHLWYMDCLTSTAVVRVPLLCSWHLLCVINRVTWCTFQRADRLKNPLRRFATNVFVAI